MKAGRIVASSLLLLVFVGLLAAGTYYLFQLGRVAISLLLSSALVLALAPLALKTISPAFMNYLQRQRELSLQLSEHRVGLYETFMENHFDDVLRTAQALETSQGKVGAGIGIDCLPIVFRKSMVLWASDETVRAYVALSDEHLDGSSAAAAVSPLDRLDGLLRSMRKDLAHTNSKIKSRDLVALFAPEVRELPVPPKRKRSSATSLAESAQTAEFSSVPVKRRRGSAPN